MRLNREYVPMYVPKVLAVIHSICSLHVILLLKMALGYFALFTNVMFLPFSLSPCLGFLVSSMEIDCPSLPIIELYIPVLTP